MRLQADEKALKCRHIGAGASGSFPRLKIVVSPVRVRVSPLPKIPANRGVLLVLAPDFRRVHPPGTRLTDSLSLHHRVITRQARV